MKCKRCGNCCIDVGRTFWKNRNYTEKGFVSSKRNMVVNINLMQGS